MKQKTYWMLFILMTAGLFCGYGVIRKKADCTDESGQKQYILAAELEEMGTPVALTYSEQGESRNEWKITDATIIGICMKDLKQLAIRKETELRAADAGEKLVFQMPDESSWTLEFEGENLLRNGKCYETEGWKNVQKMIQEYLTEEGMR